MQTAVVTKTDSDRGVDIFCHRDPQSFLNEAFAYLQKKNGQRYSLRAISRRHKIRSVATLSMVLSGKRKITPEVSEKLIEILKLRGSQRRYFETLVELDSATDLDKRAELEDQLLALRQVGESRSLENKQYKFLSEWHYVALFVLVGQEGFRHDSEHLAKRLRGRVTTKQVDEALSNMLSLGLLKEENGQLLQAHGPILKTEEDTKNLSIRKFQRTMMRKAQDALFLPMQKREITGLTLGVPKQCLPEIKKRIRRFREELDEFVCSQGAFEDVFQLNMQFFPLTSEEPK